MEKQTRTGKRIITSGLLSVFVFLFLFAGVFTFGLRAHAQDTEAIFATAEAAAGASESSCMNGGLVGTPCVGRGIKESLRTIGGKIVSPAFRIALIQALLNLSQFVLDRLAYEAAVAIASGGPGEDSLFYKKEPAEAFAQLGLEVAGEAVGMLSGLSSDELGVKFNLCDPGKVPGGNLAIDLALAIGIKQKYKPTSPKCNILEVGANWSAFFTNAFQTITDPQMRQDAILSKFAESLRPGKNELTATLRINIAIDEKVHEQKLLQFSQQNEKEYKGVTDFITGNVKTPSSTLQNKFESQLEEVNGDQSKIQVGQLVNAGELIGGLALTTASTFTNTLLSTLLNRVYTGLFDTEPDADPFDWEAPGGGGREAAQERFASIISTNPIATTEYNALSEFVVCTAEGVTNRGLYNCVMDVNFLAAVSRGNSAAAITVQEAIDEGLLNGNWPLISPDNQSANQDPFCYTYGYCYGNLVKLRRARVVPVGWELAAQRNDVSDPATLQEIINGFDDCTEEGTIGSASAQDGNAKWCHLIDPNWVLKYPETQCRAVANGEIRLSNLSPGRQSVCVDSPSCIGENNEGVCTQGYGYCVQEKNAWKFRGEECPEHFASCLSFKNTDTGASAAYLVNSVDYSVCNQDNAGCLWYRTNKYFDDGGTALNQTDDSYAWLPTGETYLTSQREDDWVYKTTSNTASPRVQYEYTSASGETYDYATYTYEDRMYLTNNAVVCDEDDAGCVKLYGFGNDIVLNMVQNPSFEDDEDGNDLPDNWTIISSVSPAIHGLVQSPKYGNNSFETQSSIISQNVSLSEGNFYTFSFYAKKSSASGGGGASVVLRDENGQTVSTAGTSFGGDCVSPLSGSFQINNVSPSDWTRFECTFTVPNGTDFASVSLLGTGLFVDAVQLEVGENSNDFTQGYNRTPREAYYKIAPGYLGCEGNPTDPAACANYAAVCSSQDVGCNLYTPHDGDPSVPAIISSIDLCPSECVGYTTYKQEATQYESEDFPLYFIADKATQCSSQYVGCDSFTNLGASAAGGETVEYYTNLRYCLSPQIANGSDARKTPATFFTWEGSDNAGYQLQTWYLLESNLSVTSGVFADSGYSESRPDLAPCVHTQMVSENEVLCNDTPVNMNEVWENDQCDEHDDIFDNPDCREFFDASGNIHYREYSGTVSISDECAAYRKDESNEYDCETVSGGYWTDQGFCRYYVLPSESLSCPAEQNGCREYTGGAGRNATTILSSTFEDGTYEDYVMAEVGGTTSLSISNESLATNGHSLRVVAPPFGAGGFETSQISLGDVFDEDTPTTCTDTGGVIAAGGCEIDEDVNSDGAPDETCVVSDGRESCGALTSNLVGGKTFVVEFWAKGSGGLSVTFVENSSSSLPHDMVDIFSETSTSPDYVQLTGAWRLYSFGPLDTSSFEGFDENAVLRFTTTANQQFYIDNITLKQVEENITVVKDSWVVPSTCDANLSDANPGRYLGCEAYDDKDGNEFNLYQFSDLCSESAVGCEGFFNTFNSDSPHQEIYNARCVYSSDNDLTDNEMVNTNTPCVVNGTAYCTISAGEGYCTFDAREVFSSPLPIDTSALPLIFGIAYGPEAVEVSADAPVYIVADEKFACEESSAGCQEFGSPTFNQDQSSVLNFASTYFINRPSDYNSILCDNEALFCAQWESTKDGNFYFKDPFNKKCEYKTSVTIGNREYHGWFRAGTNTPCDSGYLVNGEQYGMWRNGDEQYDGWVGTCPVQFDLCTEFVDVVDASAASQNGTSYYFTDDELLSEESLTDSQRCNGSVSQKFGCALFNNTTISDLNYNASASYVVSTHADILFGEEPNSLQDPINCNVDGGGVFEISQADEEKLGYHTLGDPVDLCARRCSYQLELDDSLETPSSQLFVSTPSFEMYLERSCMFNSDCPTLTTSLGDEESGTCSDVKVSTSTFALGNDSNQVLKVVRDRDCSAWLACQDSKNSWNTNTNKYDSVCEAINLCVDGSQQGDRAVCMQWSESSPEVLSAHKYSARDVNWTGSEYTGYAIPNQLPVDLYDQFNISALTTCQDSSGAELSGDNNLPVACNSSDDCPDDYECTNSQSSEDYRLAYNAGPCDFTTGGNGNGGECMVGHCEESGVACATEDECYGNQMCVIGYCEETGDACFDAGDCGSGEDCVRDASSTIGSCFNNRCLSDIADENGDGFADRLENDVARGQSCRAYPEVDSPFPQEIVSEWRTYTDGAIGADGVSPSDTITDSNTSNVAFQSIPYQYVNGFQDSAVCGVNIDGTFSDCECSYNKAEYGEGVSYRYYDTQTGMDSENMPQGVCSGGPVAGIPCLNDADCTIGTVGDPLNSARAGTCSILSRVDTVYGWSGYCIERDSSIQTLGSTKQEDRACLNWLPVDQLTGATDLYGKFTSAGFALTNTYYCADVQIAYNIGTTEVGCASVQDGQCNDFDWDAFRDEADNIAENPGDIAGGEDDCIAAAWCPEGFFGVMTGCGDQSIEDENGNIMCEGETTVPDCPFFCVPKFSYKTDTDGGGSEGEPCQVPGVGAANHIQKSYLVNIDDVQDHIMKESSTEPVLGNSDIKLYVLRPDNFETAIGFYDDCLVRGVMGNEGNYYAPQNNFNDLNAVSEPSGPNTHGYYDLVFHIDSYAACSTIAQVSSQDLSGEMDLPFETYNEAWTDRLWGDSAFIAIDDPEGDNEHFGYALGTEYSPFGAALDYEIIENAVDPYPHEVRMCESAQGASQVAPVDFACEGDYPSQEGDDARAFLDVNINSLYTTADAQWCENPDCSCESGDSCNYDHNLNAEITCDNFECDSGNTCLVDSDCADGSDCVGECVGGESAGEECTATPQCRSNYCRWESPFVCLSDSGQNQATISSYDVADALGRLEQIFGRAYRLLSFEDGYDELPEDPSTMSFAEGEKHGKFTQLDQNQWDDWDEWDSLVNGDSVEAPQAPVIRSVGMCSGVECYEGSAGTFSINSYANGELLGGGSMLASASFFAYADSNQMPLRRVIMDWGDDFDGAETVDNDVWPTGRQSGSDADDNFYKNHRGLDSAGEEVCSSQASEFGKTPEACATGYINFTHNYVCSQGDVESLETTNRECIVDDETGRLVNPPCTGGDVGADAVGACVFQPRAHAMDNWGWCTGYCDNGATDPSGNDGCWGEEECEIEECPGNELCIDTEGPDQFDNPWINWDGYIILRPE